MNRTRRSKLVAACYFAASSLVYGHTPASMPLNDVVTHLASGLKSLECIQGESDDRMHVSNPTAGDSWERMSISYAADRDRLRYSFRLWTGLRSSDESTSEEKAELQEFLWDGKIFYEYHVPSGILEARYFVIRRDRALREKVEMLRRGRALDGWIDGDIDPLPTILTRGQSSLQSSLETVHDDECYVINSKGNDGTYTVWVDPDRGFLVTKAQVDKGDGQSYFGAPISPKRGSGPDSNMRIVHYTFELNVNSFIKKNAQWVPQSATIERSVVFNNGKQDSEHEVIQRTSVDVGGFNNDAFKPIFPDSTRLLDSDYSGPIHWNRTGGKIEPLTDSGMKAEIEKGARDLNRD